MADKKYTKEELIVIGQKKVEQMVKEANRMKATNYANSVVKEAHLADWQSAFKQKLSELEK